MDSSPSFLSILPNLSIGVVAVLSQVLVVKWFLDALDKRVDNYEKAMDEREKSMRNVEADVRNTFASALTQSTMALEQNSKVLNRVMQRLDGGR